MPLPAEDRHIPSFLRVRIYCGVFIFNEKHDRKGLSENSSMEIVKEHYKHQGHQMKAASKAHSRMSVYTTGSDTVEVLATGCCG